MALLFRSAAALLKAGQAVALDSTFCPQLHEPQLRSSLRAQVWDPSRYMARQDMPSLSQMIVDQTRPAERDQVEHDRLVCADEAQAAEAYRCLY